MNCKNCYKSIREVAPNSELWVHTATNMRSCSLRSLVPYAEPAVAGEIETNGPGKYDEVATYAREKTGARGVILIVFGGNKGSGMTMQAEFEVQADIETLIGLPRLLRNIADGIESSNKPEKKVDNGK